MGLSKRAAAASPSTLPPKPLPARFVTVPVSVTFTIRLPATGHHAVRTDPADRVVASVGHVHVSCRANSDPDRLVESRHGAGTVPVAGASAAAAPAKRVTV